MAIKKYRKYKYYFKKPRSEIGRDILYWLLTIGTLSIAATSPYFLINVFKHYKKLKKYPKRKVSDTFYNLKRQGLINIQKDNQQIYISLTKEGKKRAGWLQIDSLKISKPKKWDKKWRIVMFDVIELRKVYRDALRGKLKELGFQFFQKSSWIYPFDCQAEIDLLRTFFGLSDQELRLVIAEDIGDSKKFRILFKLP